jgi:hypothetical protein
MSVSGNVNDPARLEEIRDLNELTACCAEVSADVENNKQKTEEATAKAAESEEKKKKAEADDAKKRVESCLS